MFTAMFCLEILGVLSFAVSGAALGIKKNMDIFGIATLGLTTAIGGGITRDLLLGNSPPLALKNPLYAAAAIAGSLICFVIAAKKPTLMAGLIYDRVMLLTDSLGLGLFAVIGVRMALEGQYKSNAFMAALIGTIAAVGGGALRDIISGSVPVIMIKHIYASAALGGSLACALLWDTFGGSASMAVGGVIIFALRILAARYRWNLPRVKTAGNPKEHIGGKV
ncbi:MAG: trimeric intracellular cation channel family protein [Eubacteriales bacterium]